MWGPFTMVSAVVGQRTLHDEKNGILVKQFSDKNCSSKKCQKIVDRRVEGSKGGNFSPKKNASKISEPFSVAQKILILKNWTPFLR